MIVAPPDLVPPPDGSRWSDGDEIDPFVPEPELPPGFVPPLPEVKIPRHLEGRVALPLIDAGKVLRDMGVPIGEGE